MDCNNLSAVNNTTDANAHTRLPCSTQNVPITISSIVLVLSIYLVVMLAVYETQKRDRTRKWSCINRLYLIPVFLCICNSIVTIATVSLINPDAPTCKALFWFGRLTHGSGLSVCYTILWLRQQNMYNDRRMQEHYDVCRKVVSYMVIVGVYSSVLAGWISIAVMMNRVGLICPEKTQHKGRREDLTVFIVITVLFQITSFVSHMSLLCLIAWPLLKTLHGHKRQYSCPSALGGRRVRGARHHLDTDMWDMMWRLVICATMCVLSSTTVGVLIILQVIPNAPSVDNVTHFFPVNLLIYASSIVFTFADWRRRIFPFLFEHETPLAQPKSSIRSTDNNPTHNNLAVSLGSLAPNETHLAQHPDVL